MGFEVADELHVDVKDTPGALAAVLGAVAGAGVAVRALCGYGMGGSGHVLLVPADAKKASAALKKAGYKVTAAKVVVATVKDTKGAGAKLASAAGKAKINLEYAYASGTGKGQGVVVLAAGKKTPALAKALK